MKRFFKKGEEGNCMLYRKEEGPVGAHKVLLNRANVSNQWRQMREAKRKARRGAVNYRVVDFYKYKRGSCIDRWHADGCFFKRGQLSMDLKKVESVKKVSTYYKTYSREKLKEPYLWGLMYKEKIRIKEKKHEVIYYETTMTSGKPYLLDVNVLEDSIYV